MPEYAKNYYRNIYGLEDKDTLIELIIQKMETINTQCKVLVDAGWISKYKNLNCKLWALDADLVEQNQQLKQELEERNYIIEKLTKELEDANK